METIDIPGVGAGILPQEFAVFTGPPKAIEIINAQTSPLEILNHLAADAWIVLTGEYRYADAVHRYCQRFERKLVKSEEVAHIADRVQRRAAFADARRRKLHHLLLVAQGDSLLQISDPPDTEGLQSWLQESTGARIFLIPIRRLQRVLTDMRRAREGLVIDALGGAITIFPHVYVPADLSVPRMLLEFGSLLSGKRVLDMGTGTGVLALLAARLRADKVIATDINPKAVANARENASRLKLTQTVEVRDAGDLFSPVEDELFDVIIFNAPWMRGEPQTLYDAALYDPGYRVLTGFLRGATAHLSQEGIILLQYSNISQRRGEDAMGNLYSAIAANGLQIVSERSIDRRSRVLGSMERVFLFEIRRKSETACLAAIRGRDD